VNNPGNPNPAVASLKRTARIITVLRASTSRGTLHVQLSCS